MEEQNIRVAIDRHWAMRLPREIKFPNIKSTTMTSCASIHSQAK